MNKYYIYFLDKQTKFSLILNKNHLHQQDMFLFLCELHFIPKLWKKIAGKSTFNVFFCDVQGKNVLIVERKLDFITNYRRTRNYVMIGVSPVPDWTWRKSRINGFFVCNRHFSPNDYRRKNKRILKDFAINNSDTEYCYTNRKFPTKSPSLKTLQVS